MILGIVASSISKLTGDNYTLNSIVYSGKFLDVSVSAGTSPYKTIERNGQNIYITNSGSLYDYSITGNDISTGTKDDTFETGSNAQGLHFNSTGTKIIYGNPTFDTQQRTLSTGWDITSAGAETGATPATTFTTVGGFTMKPDGTKCYQMDPTDNKVYQYKFNTAWDATSIEYDSKSLDTSTDMSGEVGLTFNPTGTILLILDRANDSVFQYNLSIAWDVSSGSYDQSFDLSSETVDPKDLCFNTDGSILYVIDADNHYVHQYNLLGELYSEDDAADTYNEYNNTGNWVNQNTSMATSTDVPTGGGTYSIKVTSLGTSSYSRAELTLSLDDATDYTIKIWAKRGVNTESLQGIAGWTGFVTSPSQYLTADGWTEYTFNVTTNSTSQLIRVYSNNSGTSSIVDEVLFDKISILKV